MNSGLYETKLAKHKIFQDLKDGLKEDSSGKLRNLLVLKDDVLYVWSPNENCLLCLNITRLEESGDDTPYQKLHLVTPPAFTVERIISSVCGSRLCVWGSRGVTVVELPTRWGRGGLFESGSQTVLCKSATLDERFLYSQGEVRRVHWHPSFLSRLLVLVSDNTIRVYNIALKSGPKVVKIFPIGPKPTGLLAGRTLLDSLGDTAVDFTPAPDERLLILRGNGDVYMTSADLEGTNSSSPPKLSGPLAMYPPADDNYGTDSCSITALGGGDTPPLVVVATCSAALYHCLLLPNPTDKEDGDGHALYVVEAVELNMVLTDDVDMQSSYPVHLYPCTNNTYACVHAGGVHTIALPILGHLKDYALADEAETETVLSAMCSKPSVARHLVCTHGPSSTFSPPIGLCLTVPPLPWVLVLCTDCTLIVRRLMAVRSMYTQQQTETVLSALCSKPSVARHLVCTHGPSSTFSPPIGLCLTVPPLPWVLVLCTDCTLLVRRLVAVRSMYTQQQTETVLSAMCSKPSVARHLVCTHGPSSTFSPPIGLCLTVPPLPWVLVLCTDCTLIVRSLEPYDLEEQLFKELQLKNPALEQDEIDSILKERQKLSFTAIVQEILSRDVSQPILNMNKSEEPALKETLELVSQATMKLRVSYMQRQQRALDTLARKLRALSDLAQQHRNWLRDLQEEVDEVKLQSTVLKDKCTLAEKHQDDIKYRCSVAIRQLRASCESSPAERALLAELEQHARGGERLAEQIATLKRHARDKSEQLKKWEEEYKKKDIALGKSHSDTISSILQQQTKQISTLIEETKLLKDQLSIV